MVWQSQANESVLIDYRQSIQENPAFSAVLNHSPCVNSIIDLRRQQFNFISTNTEDILGMKAVFSWKKGWHFVIESFIPMIFQKPEN